MLVDIHLRQQRNEFRRFMDEYAVFLGTGNDFFGNQPFALRNHARGRIGLLVGQRDRFAGRVILRGFHAER